MTFTHCSWLGALVLTLVGCSGSPEPASERPDEPAAPATGLRLNEVRILPADGAPVFIEIVNIGDAVRLDDVDVQNAAGAAIELPRGITIEPGAMLVLLFDDAAGSDRTVVHLPSAALAGGVPGRLELRVENRVADVLVWGRPELASVSLCRGGRCGAPDAGSVLARVPDAPAPGDATAWALLDAELATPGSPNPRPPVSAFAGLPGFIFTGAPRFSWYSVPGAARYRLEVARNDDFAELVHEAEISGTAGQLEQLSAQGPQLPPGEYAWRVRAIAASGAAAAPSVAVPFSVDPSRALAAPSGTTAPAAEGRPPLSPPRVPEGMLKVLDVPIMKHAKDTRMLTLEAASETVWDSPNEGGYPYCARAGVAMVNAFYGGKLSQDRIGYEVFSKLASSPPGAEYDLPVVGIDDTDTSTYSLPLALGTRGRYVANVDYAYGSHRSACIDYVSSAARAQCASRCADPQSQECFECRRAAEAEIACPAEIAHRWGFLAIEDIQREIDAGRPIIATTSGHLFLIVGYRLEEGRFYFFYQDAGGRQEVQANASGLMDRIVSYWTGLAAISIGSDEPEVNQDSDGDGVVDFDERRRFGTAESNPDTDGDEVPDKEEIRASVWDPQHGYHRGVASLAPTAPMFEVEQRAAAADLSGRDFDGDGMAMELDRDSDGGGCRDGLEDVDFDGVRSGRETYNFDPDDDACEVALGGRVTMRYGFVSGHRPACQGTVEIRLKFALEPEWGEVPEEARTAVAPVYMARAADYELSTEGCVDIVGGTFDFFDSANVACNAPGARREGTIEFGVATTSDLAFFPLQPSLHVTMPWEALPELIGTCVYRDGSTSELSIGRVGSEFLEIGSGSNCETSERHVYGQGPNLLSFCVEPTVCNTSDADPATLGECFTRPDRYAVIPFRGSLSKLGGIEQGTDIEGNDFPIEIDGAQVRYEICRGCGEQFLD